MFIQCNKKINYEFTKQIRLNILIRNTIANGVYFYTCMKIKEFFLFYLFIRYLLHAPLNYAIVHRHTIAFEKEKLKLYK